MKLGNHIALLLRAGNIGQCDLCQSPHQATAVPRSSKILKLGIMFADPFKVCLAMAVPIELFERKRGGRDAFGAGNIVIKWLVGICNAIAVVQQPKRDCLVLVDLSNRIADLVTPTAP